MESIDLLALVELDQYENLYSVSIGGMDKIMRCHSSIVRHSCNGMVQFNMTYHLSGMSFPSWIIDLLIHE